MLENSLQTLKGKLTITVIPLQKRNKYSSSGLVTILFAAYIQCGDFPANSTFDLS